MLVSILVSRDKRSGNLDARLFQNRAAVETYLSRWKTDEEGREMDAKHFEFKIINGEPVRDSNFGARS